MDETLTVDLHGRGHHTRIRLAPLSVVLVHASADVLNNQQRLSRRHHRVRQKYALVVGYARVDHHSCGAGIACRQQIQILTHLRLGGARTIGHLDPNHASDHQHSENTDEDPDQFDAFLTRRRHRRESNATAARDRRIHPRMPRLWNRNRRIHRFIFLSAHHVLLTPIDNR